MASFNIQFATNICVASFNIGRKHTERAIEAFIRRFFLAYVRSKLQCLSPGNVPDELQAGLEQLEETLQTLTRRGKPGMAR